MSNGFNFNVSSAYNAARCLMNMKELENTSNFGKLKDEETKDNSNKRYNIEEYKDKIDSTFFTDAAAATFMLTVRTLNTNLGFSVIGGDSDDLFSKTYVLLSNYSNDGTKDLINDSEGFYANFKGDESILENSMSFAEDETYGYEELYAYYNGFQVVTGEEKQDVLSKNRFTIDPDFEDTPVYKKTENINGVEIDFYYVNDELGRMHTIQMLQHDYNASFLKDRMPANILEATMGQSGNNDIIMLGSDYYERAVTNGLDSNSFAAYTWRNGNIVVKDNYFCDAICHEIGHLFDYTNMIDIGVGYLNFDYNMLNLGIWDNLARKYAENIETIRIGADISCGYSTSGMLEQHNEFYAEAFQLYFYSPETRAALPEAVRNRIETEINRWTK